MYVVYYVIVQRNGHIKAVSAKRTLSNNEKERDKNYE